MRYKWFSLHTCNAWVVKFGLDFLLLCMLDFLHSQSPTKTWRTLNIIRNEKSTRLLPKLQQFLVHKSCIFFYLLTNCGWTVTSDIERCDHTKLCVWMFTVIKIFPAWKTKPNIFKMTNYAHKLLFVTQEQERWNYRHLRSPLWDPRKCQREIKKS